MDTKEVAQSMDFFFTTHKWRENPTYTYSGNFGVPITGLGVGLPVSQQYAATFGGAIQVVAQATLNTNNF